MFLALSIASLLAAVGSTVASTAPPVISGDLDAGELRTLWPGSDAFLRARHVYLRSTAALPLFGKLADIFGSGISGGSTSTTMLIAGRAVQGIGGRGINLMIEMIVCDRVPLRDRGRFTGVIFVIFAIETSLGPFIGGTIMQNISWRWVFYVNLPIASTSLVLLIAFPHANYRPGHFTFERLRYIDYTGNFILVASVTAILPWSSWRVLLPSLLGFVGLVGFYLFGTSLWCSKPMTPKYLFPQWDICSSLLLDLHSRAIFLPIIYFMPVHFQAVLLIGLTRSGVLIVPTVVVIVLDGLVSGLILSHWRRYRPLHLIGFTMITLGVGLFTLLNRTSHLALCVVFQLIAGISSGLVLTTLLPATQASLEETDTASWTAVWSFVRSFETVWGVSVPAAIFSSRADALLYQIQDESVRTMIVNGQAYWHASSSLLRYFTETTRNQVIGVFGASFRLVWIVAVALTGASILVVFIEKEIKLRDDLNTEFGLKDSKQKPELDSQPVSAESWIRSICK
ncbi:major facilitator superfamily domain-containing protein [Xylaria acuta]|nr:major facilitator superfamily domain-containing protein [Xylaria acuta]